MSQEERETTTENASASNERTPPPSSPDTRPEGAEDLVPPACVADVLPGSLTRDFSVQTIRLCNNPKDPEDQQCFTSEQALIDTGARGFKGFIANDVLDSESQDVCRTRLSRPMTVKFGNEQEAEVDEVVTLTFRIDGEDKLFEDIELYVAPDHWKNNYNVLLANDLIQEHSRYFLDLWARQNNDAPEHDEANQEPDPLPVQDTVQVEAQLETPSRRVVRRFLSNVIIRLRTIMKRSKRSREEEIKAEGGIPRKKGLEEL